MVTLFKPNKKNNGVLASFQKVKNENNDRGEVCVMLNIVRQSSWDDSKKTGSFRWGENDRKDNTKNVKLNVFELGSLIHGFENYLEGVKDNSVNLFHRFNDTSTAIWLGRHKGGEGNFVFSVSEGNNKFLFGITPGEAVVISEFFRTVIQENAALQHELNQRFFEKTKEKSGGGRGQKRDDNDLPDEPTEDGDDDEGDIPF